MEPQEVDLDVQGRDIALVAKVIRDQDEAFEAHQALRRREFKAACDSVQEAVAGTTPTSRCRWSFSGCLLYAGLFDSEIDEVQTRHDPKSHYTGVPDELFALAVLIGRYSEAGQNFVVYRTQSGRFIEDRGYKLVLATSEVVAKAVHSRLRQERQRIDVMLLNHYYLPGC